LGVDRLYPDYRQMLEREKPDLVSIGPRWVTDRLPMVQAAAAAGCHLYCEKPFAGDLVTADGMLAACQAANVKIAVAHQFRAMPPVRETFSQIRAGKFGRILRIKARPKDDSRGGGEDLIVHGTHLLDLMIGLAGDPRWVSGHVAVGDRDATREDAHAATEPLGPVAGNSISAMFGFDGGVRGYIDTTINLDRKEKPLYGLVVECETASLHIRPRGEVYIYPAPLMVPENANLAFERVWVQDWHFDAEHQPRALNNYIDLGNKVLVTDLIESIEKDREPLASGRAAYLAIEMIQGVYASHFAAGARLPIPLVNRHHPLTTA
jgi:predicted dehydrogenase